MASNSPLCAKPGDRLVVRGHTQGEAERDAEVLRSSARTEGLLVRWEAGHEAEIFRSDVLHPAPQRFEEAQEDLVGGDARDPDDRAPPFLPPNYGYAGPMMRVIFARL
jgi:hypothetical protein